MSAVPGGPDSRTDVEDRDRRAPLERSALPTSSPPIVGWLLLVLLLTAAFIAWNEHRFQCDDAYISYRYAANLAAGEGLVFNPGERVEGYSNFLWIMLLAFGARLGVAPHLLGPVAGVVAYLASIFVCWSAVWTGRLGTRQGWSHRLAATAMVALLITAHGFAASAGAGLETHFFALLILVAGLGLSLTNLDSVRSLLGLGLLPPALVLTRPDGLIPAAVIIAIVFLRSSLERRSRRTGALATAICVIPGFVIGLAYLGFKHLYFGSLIPNPYYAKGADTLHADAGLAYFIGFLRSYSFVAVGILMTVWLLLRHRRDEPITRLAVFSLLTFGGYWAFLIKVGGDFMEYRLALHLLPMVVMIAIIAATEITGSRVLQSSIAALMIGLSLPPAVMETRFYMQTLQEMDRYAVEGRRVGLALRSIPPHTKVATTLIGTVAYFSNRPIVDQWGLVDPGVRERRPRKNFFRGHVRFTNLREAQRLGAGLYLDHPHLCRCSISCLTDTADILIATERGECVRARVLDFDPELLRVIDNDPDRFPQLGSAVARAERKRDRRPTGELPPTSQLPDRPAQPP
jgi:hypothetical protein